MYYYLVLFFFLSVVSSSNSPITGASTKNDCRLYYTTTLTTMFSQGMWASRGQAAKYSKAGIEVDGQRVTYSQANDIVYNLVDYPELSQVGYGWTLNPLHLLMQAVTYCYKSWYYYWSQGEQGHHIYMTAVDIAGPTEVAEHAEAWRAYNHHLDTVSKIADHGHGIKRQLVLFGTSRGAATVFTSVSLSTAYERRHLKLVVLEAPFHSVEQALHYRYGEALLGPLAFSLVKQYTNFSENFLSPARAAWKFPLDVPVVFVTSEVDQVVPPNHTKFLIDLLKVRQHPAVHHLRLENSEHSAMSLGDGEDQQRYVKFMAEMYERYCGGGGGGSRSEHETCNK